MSILHKEVGVLKVFIRTYALMIKRCPKDSCLMVLFTIFGGIFAGGVTYIWKILFENTYAIIEGTASFESVLLILVLLICINIIQKGFDILSGLYRPKFMEQIKFSLLAEIHEKVDDIPLEYYEDPYLYDTIHRSNQVISGNVFMRFFMGSFVALSNLINVISISIVLATFNPWLIVLCLVSVIPPFISRLVRGSGYYHMKSYQTPKVRIQNYLWSLLVSKDSVKELKIFGSGDYLKNKWANHKKNLQSEEWNFVKKHGFIQLVVDSSTILGLGLGIFSLIFLLLNNVIKIGELGASMMALQSVQSGFSSFLVQISLVGERVPFVSVFFEFLDKNYSSDTDGLEFTRLKHEIKLKNIDFAYHGNDNTVLKDINLTIKKGERVAFIGENGAGKSTLVKIILGLYKPVGGTVIYDGIDLVQYDKKTFYKQVSPVYQDYVKYLLTLRENVIVGDITKDYNEQNVLGSLGKVDFLEDLKKFPDGIDTQMGREFDGVELSVGQWQKLAIARGIIGNKDIMVLDEPTASLDPMIEAAIFKGFLDISKGNTTILVSHRIGSARIADRIIVLEEGQVVEDGSHEELMNIRGKYYELYNLQAQWYTA